ncbi:MAG: hypothetical protein Ta2A_26040 [Treponemataceae bacterium]|nr:MAG: hypothetical protein Ta2A_26040 [Treponemataceae bacterium]
MHTAFSDDRDIRVATSLLAQTLGWLWRGVLAALAGSGMRVVVPQLRVPIVFLRAGCYATAAHAGCGCATTDRGCLSG